MTGNTNSSHFSSTDIQKYLEGKLSAPEMHAIEKAALDDPFLADAIEGMQNHLQESGNQSFDDEVNELNERLKNKIRKKQKTIAMPPNRIWQRIAAVTIILIGSMALIYHYISKDFEKNKAIAIKKEKATTDSPVSKNNLSPAVLKKDSPMVNDLAVNEKKKTRVLPENNPKPNFLKRDKTDKELLFKETKIAPLKQEKIDHPSNIETAKADEAKKTSITIKTDSLNTDNLKKQLAFNNVPGASLQAKAAGISIQPSRQSNIYFVQGIVVDNQHNPVVGATVKLKNKKTATSTDADGVFKLHVQNNDSLTKVVIASAGYHPTDFLLNNHDASSNLIELQPDTSALSEVVVTGYSAKKEDDNNEGATASYPKKEKEVFFKAEPSVGWPAFNDYINQNKKITTTDSVKKGEEIISFIVDTSNQLSSFKIKKSLSPAHDTEAIRLIKQGPPWKLLKRKKAKVTLAIEF